MKGEILHKIHRRLLGYVIFIFLCALLATPSRAADCGPLKQLSSIDLMPIRGENTFAVKAEVNGTPVLLRLSTGEVFSELTAATGDKLGLIRLNRKTTLVDLDGWNADPARAKSFKVGHIRVDWPDFGLAAKADLAHAGLDGMLAPNFIMEDDVELDFTRRKMNLFSSDHCTGKVVYWPAASVAVIAFKMSKAGQIEIPVELDGVQVHALVDTGASFSAINVISAKRTFHLRFNEDAAPGYDTRHAELDAKLPHHRFKQLDLGGVIIGNPQLAILADRNSSLIWNLTADWGKNVIYAGTGNLLIGMDVLSHLHIYIAYKEKKLYITPASAPAGGTGGQHAATAR